MHITFITLQDDLNVYGLRCLSSVLRKMGVTVRLILLDRYGPHKAALAYNGEEKLLPQSTLEEITELCRGSDLVGFSVMTLYYHESARLSDHLKQALQVPILWGGIHPICFPEECLQHADMICMGEAEESLAELVRCLDLGQEPKDVAGVWYRRDGSIIRNATRQPAHDLDQFPMPDIGTEDHFVYRRGSFRPLDREELVKRWGHHYMTINARGCSMRCTYCCNSQLARRFDWTFVRRKSVPAIIAELKEVKRLYPELRGIKFSDDAFGDLPLEYIEEFAGAYKKEIGLPLGIPGFSPSNLTEEKLAPLVDAGLVYVRIGIQSGSPDIRKLYGRRDTNEQIVNAVNAVQTFGKKIERFKLDMITDNPWEDDEDVIASVKLLLELPKPYVLALFSLTLFPGTPLYTKARREGIVSDENPIYRRHFYNLGKEPPLNRLLDLFRRKVVLKDRILEMLEVYQDAEQFEKLFAEYMKALPKSYLGRILPRRKKEVMW